MAKSLVISKQTGNYFTFDLTVDSAVFPQVANDANHLLTYGTLCDFKTVNGASIVKRQQIDVTEITLIAGGTFTFASTLELWLKLIEVGFFDGLGTGGGSGGVDRFDELLDTFTYTGKNGYVPVVNESMLKLDAVPFYNINTFLQLQDTPIDYVANKMVVVNATGDGLIFINQPDIPETYFNAAGYFDYNDLATQTTPISVLSGIPKKLTNDALGVFTVTDQAPYGVTSVWNTTTNQFDFSQMSVGDQVSMRIDIIPTTTSANQILTLSMKFAIGSAAEYTQIIKQAQVKSAGAFPITFDMMFYIGSEDVRDYPAQIDILSDGNASVVVNGWYPSILRKNINIVDVVTPDHNDLTGLNVGDYQHITVSEKNSFANKLESVGAGTNITIDNTDPLNPVISSSGGGGGGAVDSVNGQTGTVVLDTDDISEGSTNLYFTTARVLAALLTGISFATGGAIVSTDSVLVAFGKIQKQITDLISGKQDIANQIAVSTSQTIPDSWHGKMIIIGASVTLTVPASFANTQMNFDIIVKNGFTVTWAITSPKVWANGTPVPTLGTTSYTICTFLQEDSTNNIMLLGL